MKPAFSHRDACCGWSPQVDAIDVGEGLTGIIKRTYPNETNPEPIQATDSSLIIFRT